MSGSILSALLATLLIAVSNCAQQQQQQQPIPALQHQLQKPAQQFDYGQEPGDESNLDAQKQQQQQQESAYRNAYNHHRSGPNGRNYQSRQQLARQVAAAALPVPAGVAHAEVQQAEGNGSPGVPQQQLGGGGSGGLRNAQKVILGNEFVFGLHSYTRTDSPLSSTGLSVRGQPSNMVSVVG